MGIEVMFSLEAVSVIIVLAIALGVALFVPILMKILEQMHLS